MILLTKLDNKEILVTLETIKYIESVPDTIVFFTNGDSIMVKESLQEVVSRVEKHQSDILRLASSST
jgi:flagellar protein FlbD